MDHKKTKKIEVSRDRIFDGKFEISNSKRKNQNSCNSPIMKVRLANDVYRCCFHHALSSQAEEVMGILIGEKIIEKNVGVVIESKFLTWYLLTTYLGQVCMYIRNHLSFVL